MPKTHILRWNKDKYNYLKDNGISNETQVRRINSNEFEKDNLEKIYLTRKRMLDINIRKNDIKNKRIYMMFIFIIIIVLVITIIHFKNSK